MISYINSTKDIIIALRNEIITQAEIPSNYVLNALSFYGTEMHRSQNGIVFDSFSQEDTFIIFELNKRDTSDTVNYSSGDDIINYASYVMRLNIYGEDCDLLSRKLRSRLLSEEVRNNLYEKGVYIQNIPYPESINEYINEVMWEREDLEIEIAVRFNINKITINDPMESLGSLEIYKTEDE